MAVNRVTRTSAVQGWRSAWVQFGSAIPATGLALVLLGLDAAGELPTSLGAGLIILLALIGGAALVRAAFPPRSKAAWVQLTAQTDAGLLAIAGLSVVGHTLGSGAELVFPLTLALLVWTSVTQPRPALWMVGGYAVLTQWAVFWGRGAWSGDLDNAISHTVFIVGFGALAHLILRQQVQAAQAKAARAAKASKARTDRQAHSLGLKTQEAAQEPDISARVEQIRQATARVLGISRQLVGAHSAVLMTRANERAPFEVFCAVTREQDLLVQAPVAADAGTLSVLTRMDPDAAGLPVLRISPLDGRTRPLPYYTHTPARINSVMGAPVMRGDEMVGALFFDRTAGAGFDDASATKARELSALLGDLLQTERALMLTDRRSQTMNHLLAAGRALSEAFGPEAIYKAVLEATHQIAPVRFAALIVRQGPKARVVQALGDGANACVGIRLASTTSLAAMVLKTPTTVPPSRAWSPAHGALFEPGLGPDIKTGEPVLALPLTVAREPVGALVLVARDPLDDTTVNTLKVLAAQAAVSVEHAQALAELQTRASTDALTALDNRGTVLAKLDRSLARAGRSSQSVGLLLLDIDHFKTVNDTHGHQAGDMVLRQIARTLEDSKRINDAVGRYGGEEFLMVLEDTNAAGARLVAERIRSSIASLAFPSQTGPFRVTASIGFAMAPADGERADGLLKRADKALYRAKDAGRDRVMAHGEALLEGPSVRVING